MPTYTASVERDAEQAAALRAAAKFFGLPMPAFLNLCLEQGIEWAQGMAGTADMDGEPEDRAADGQE